MRSTLTVAFVSLLLAFAVPVSAQAPPHYWSRGFGGATNGDRSSGIAVDPTGNVLLTGLFGGTADFGGGNFVSTGAGDIFFAKYSPSGTHQWSQHFGVTGASASMLSGGVAVDGAGNVFATGAFRGTIDFGGGPLTSVGTKDIYLVKFDGNGQYQWSQRFGQTADCDGYRVATDAAGNVIVAGRSGGDVNFGGGVILGSGNVDFFVAKYDASGVHQWSRIFGRFGGVGDTEVTALALDGSGNPVVAGFFEDTINLGGNDLVSAGFEDIFVAKFSAAGLHLWSHSYGSAAGETPSDVAVDGTGNVVVTGAFHDPVNFGGGALTSAGNLDIFLVRLNPAGGHAWSKRLGGAAQDNGVGVALDASGSALVTGFFGGTADFGGGPLVSAGSFDVFLAKFDAAGAHQWSERFGAAGADKGSEVAVDGSSVVATGTFNDTVSFGGADLVSAGGADIYLAKYTSPPTAVNGTPKHDALSISSYPNPFNPRTTVSYTVPSPGAVTVAIYDASGARVATLFKGERAAGAYSVDWDGSTDDAALAASGVYFVRIEHSSGARTKKMMLLK